MKQGSIGILTAVAALLGTQAAAGDLKSFERSVSGGHQPQSRPAPPRQAGQPVLQRSGHRGCISGGLVECLVGELFIGPFVDLTGMLTMMSMARVGVLDGEGLDGVEPRVAGDPDLPYAAVDLSVMQAGTSRTATDARAEVGFGAFALVARTTRYREVVSASTSGGELSLQQNYFLFRMAPSRTFQLGVGAGQSVLTGLKQTVGTSLIAPVSVCPDHSWCLRLLPTWNTYPGGHETTEYDWSVAWTQAFLSLRLGYRWSNSGVEVIEGPTAGLTLHF